MIEYSVKLAMEGAVPGGMECLMYKLTAGQFNNLLDYVNEIGGEKIE